MGLLTLLAMALVPGAVAFAADPQENTRAAQPGNRAMAAQLKQARAWLHKNRPDLSRQVLDRAARLYPDEPLVLAHFVDWHLRQGEKKQALDVLKNMQVKFAQTDATKQAEQLYAALQDERLGRLRLLNRSGQYVQAAQLARELFPQPPTPLGGLLIDYTRTLGGLSGQRGQAVQRLMELYRQTDEGEYWLAAVEVKFAIGDSSLQLLTDIEPLSKRSDINEYTLKSIWLFVLDNWSGEVGHEARIRAFMKRYPDEPGMKEKIREAKIAEPDILKAKQEAQKRAEQEAAKAAAKEQERKDRADKLDALKQLAGTQVEQQKFEEAVQTWQRALAMQPGDPWTRHGLARTYIRMQKHDAAIGVMNEGVHLMPRDEDALYARALIRSALDDEEGARSDLLQIPVKKRSDGMKGLLQVSEANLKTSKEKAVQAQAAQALQLAQQKEEQAQLLREKQAKSLRDKGQSQAQSGALAEAAESYRESLKLQNQDPWTRYALARVLLRMQQPDQALGVMKEGIQLSPVDDDMRYATALIRGAVDDDEGAMKELATVPVSDQSDGMRRLARQSRVKILTRLVETPADEGFANGLQTQAEPLAGDDAGMLYNIALAWFRLEQPMQAVAVYDRLFARLAQPTQEHLLDRIIVLSRARQDVQAAALLDKAAAMPDWQPAQRQRLLSLMFENRQRLAAQAREAGQTQRAEQIARQPLPLQWADSQFDVDAAQQSLYTAAGLQNDAQQALRRRIERQPNDTALPQELTQQQQQQKEALEREQARLAQLQKEALAEGLRQKGDAQAQAGALKDAAQSYRQALDQTPLNPWTRHALARVLLRAQEPDVALGIMKEGVRLQPTDADMRYASALIRSAVDDDAGALDDLSYVSTPEQTDGMKALLRESRVKLLTGRMRAPTDAPQASVLQTQAEPLAGDDAGMLYNIALAWFRLEQPMQAVAVYDRLFARLAQPTQEHLLDRIIVLSQARQDVQAAALLDKAAAMPDWQPAQRQRLLSLMFENRQRLAAQAREAGQIQRAEQIARQPLPLQWASPQFDVNAAQEALYSAAGLQAEVIQAMRLRVQRQPEDVALRFELAQALLKAGARSEAVDLARQLEPRVFPRDESRSMEVWRIYRQAGATHLADDLATRMSKQLPPNLKRMMEMADDQRSRGHYTQAIEQYKLIKSMVPVQAVDARRTDASRLTTTPSTEVSTMPLDTQAVALKATNTVSLVDVQKSIDGIEVRKQNWTEHGLIRLNKSGTEGISSLRGWDIPNVAWWSPDYEGPYFLHVDGVVLDSGKLPVSAADAVGFGQVGAWPATAYSPSLVHAHERGVNVGVGRVLNEFEWDVGMTGVGFPVTNLVGGVSHSRYDENSGYKLELFRRPLTGSRLSYAGSIDPVTGKSWGGVVATGVYGRWGRSFGSVSFSASGSQAKLTGRSVSDNTRSQLRFSLQTDLYEGNRQRVSTGLTLSLWRYQKDLSQYYWGQGGYYSPNKYASLGIPIEWSGRRGSWTWLASAAVSRSYSSSVTRAWYPGRPDLQNQAALLGQTPSIDGSSSTGFGRSLRLVLEYQSTPKWAIGTALDIDRSAYYSPTNLMMYVRYLFDPVRQPLEDKPRPIKPYSAF